jgi:hypothetical protein
MQWQTDEIPEPIQELIKQREELKHRRKELVKQLKEFIAELEGRPERPDLGFPFNLLVRVVYKALGAIQAFVGQAVKAFLR